MSHSALSVATDRPYATAFFGGAHRGKVIQIHMTPKALELLVDQLVEDDHSGFTEPFAEWLRKESSNAGMILFDDGLADPKVPSLLIERN